MKAPIPVPHADVIRTIYAAFSRGDVPAITSLVADKVDWNNSATAAGKAPWNADFSGKAKLPGFFAALAKHADIPVFELKEFVSEGSHVVVRVHLRIVMKKNGRAAEYDSLHFWTFDGAGKVSGYRHFNDTAAELAAWQG